jgi:hypothetical protein
MEKALLKPLSHVTTPLLAISASGPIKEARSSKIGKLRAWTSTLAASCQSLISGILDTCSNANCS